jgi:tetratricopeptide (TPR) repeat protein
LMHAYVALGDLPLAGQHLREGQRILTQDQHKHWLRWRFNIRLSLEAAHYFLARGDVAQARAHAQQSLAASKNAGAKKHMAGAHQLLGRAAAVEGKLDEAMREYRIALAIFHRHPCPMAQWTTLVAAGRTANCQGSNIPATRLLESAETTVLQLANSIRSADTQQRFLVSARTEINKARTARSA